MHSRIQEDGALQIIIVQKQLALAAAGASMLAAPAAFANATVYGHVDIGVQRVKPGGTYDGAKLFVTDQQGGSGSFLGFRATDDIGAGLQGLVVAELGFLADTGALDNTTDQLFQRQVYAGVTGAFGTLTGGRQHREVFLVGNSASYNYTAAGVGVGFLNQYTGVRQDNFIKYASPSLRGLTLVVGYAPGEGSSGTTKENGKFAEFGAKWTVGSLQLGVVTGTITFDAPGTAPIDTDILVVGGQYTMGRTTFYALHTTGEDDAVPKSLDALSISLGVRHGVGNGDVVLQVGQAKNDLTANADATLVGVGYYHRLSKMTTVYVSYADVDNDAAGVQIAPRQAAGVATVSTPAGNIGVGAAGTDPSTLSFGIRRFF